MAGFLLLGLGWPGLLSFFFFAEMMFVSKSLKKLQIRSRRNSTTHFHFHFRHSVLLQNPCFNSSISGVSSDESNQPNSSSPCVDFLIDSCGFSQEQARRAAAKIIGTGFNNEYETPRSVINFLETNGFSKTHISKFVSKCPRLLFSDVEKTLKPKIKLFQDLGLSNLKVAGYISSNPYIMFRSLESHIIPTLELVRSFVQTDENLIKTISRSYNLLSSNNTDQMQANIDLLRQHGVPDLEIGYSIMNEPRLLVVKSEALNQVIEKVKRIGFEAETRKFTLAVCVRSSMKESTWDSKMDLLKGLGWSEQQIYDAFLRSPMLLSCSEKKLKEGMDFYAKTMNWDASMISKYPMLLGFNLKGRVYPRLVIGRILMSKGIVKEEKGLITMMYLSEKDLLKKYVIKYQDTIPDLFDTYRNERIKSLQESS